MIGPSLMAMSRAEAGRGIVIAAIVAELDTVNQVTGSGLSDEAIAQCAELVFDRFKFRTINALRIAIRDGLNSGKIYGKLAYPVIAEWLIAHEEKVEDMNYQKHLSTK